MSEDRSSSGPGQKTWLDKILNAFSGEPRNRQELLDFLHDAGERQLVDTEAMIVIEGALKLTDMQVGDVTIPRSQMVVVRDGQHPHEFLPTLIESAHSRFPIIGENPDEVLGVLLAKDLLPLILDPSKMDSFNIRTLLRPATYVPEYKGLYSMLREFRETHQHMAIVVDEYGGTAGLVTIEDILEQIVGDIEDEHDIDEDDDIRPLPDGQFSVSALTPIDDFNDHFHCQFSDDEFDTIGGIVMQKFGHLPHRGESTVIDGYRFTIVNADNRRIRLLHVCPGVSSENTDTKEDSPHSNH
ncbi:magnesium/cobalt efflux protein [Terasakiispira papahanaumokuakeensis]|uniref:Magnesium and cobalt efflux protein CorC n=1 Tax=Terasakiispira papahanaumokuakeensis TaxID=197479 RepID=A0A1E2V6L0_9GAMM|nr:transporter associated domain-containing protein [Terasakiispira papahanaumokuakeensis]ODC02621.1 magnesium/cobalt efflux protein [Terasakiispira papahanaumokuakeensis]